MSLLGVLIAFYWVLAGGKLLQGCLLLFWPSNGNNGNGKRQRVEMVPSVQIMIRIVECLIGQEQELNQIPRKELRSITDPWLQNYAKNYALSPQRSKRFTSLYDAKRDFFRELCEESTGILVDLTNIAVPFVNYPLGIVSLINFSIFLMSLPFLLVREFLLTRSLQAPNILLCKIAASKTITDVYVLAAKDGIDFDTAIHRYPLTADIFNNTQLHPLVGRAACPIYKREVVFPKGDAMDFEFDFVRIPGGQAILRPKHQSLVWKLWEEILLAHYVLAVLALYLIHSQGLEQTVRVLGPPAAIFYAVRTLVDYSFAIPHDPRHHFSL